MSQNYADQLETKNYIKNFCWCIVYTIEKKNQVIIGHHKKISTNELFSI